MKRDDLKYSKKEIKESLSYCYAALMNFYMVSKKMFKWNAEDEVEFAQAEEILRFFIAEHQEE